MDIYLIQHLFVGVMGGGGGGGKIKNVTFFENASADSDEKNIYCINNFLKNYSPQLEVNFFLLLSGNVTIHPP